MVGVLIPFSFLHGDSETALHHLDLKCREAAKSSRQVKRDFYYKVLHTAEFAGWIGDKDNVGLTHAAHMVIRFAGASKTGYFWFDDNPEQKFNIVLRSDVEGNCELVAENVGNIPGRICFAGLMKDGVIRGMWKNCSNRGKTIPFYVKAVDRNSQ